MLLWLWLVLGSISMATGSLQGTVVLSEQRPLPDVTVAVRVQGTAFVARVSTDVDGRFEIDDVPLGTALLSIERYPYVGVPQAPGLPDGVVAQVDTRDPSASSNVVIQAALGGVITGRVYTELGTPAPDVTVRIQRAPASRIGQLLPLRDGVPSSTSTDDNGDYRLAGLPEGAYLIAAVPRETSSAVPVLATPDSRLIDIAERVSQKGAASPAELTALRQAAEAAAPPETVVFGPTYFPGTSDRHAATLVRASYGSTRSGVDIGLSPSRTTSVEGLSIGVDGSPVVGSTVVLIDPAAGLGLERRHSATTDENGRFRFGSVPPGTFRIATTKPAQDAGEMTAEVSITVHSQPIRNVVLVLAPGHTISGEIAAAAGGAARTLPLNLRLERFDITRRQLPGDRFETLVGTGGTFQFKNVPTGRYRLRVFTADSSPEHWGLVINGNPSDVLEVGSGLNVGAVSVLAQGPVQQFSGRVEGSRDGIPPDLAVVVVSATNDEAIDVPVTISPVATDGLFRIGPLRAGLYKIGVVWYRPDANDLPQDLVDDIRQNGQLLDLTKGAAPAVSIKIGR